MCATLVYDRMKRLLGGLLVLAVLVGIGAGLAGRSNEEQAQAIAARDASLMSDTVTSDHFQDLAQTNQDLLDHGVTSIKLVKLEWGAVAVNGSTATATTYETWTTTTVDGTVNQSRD